MPQVDSAAQIAIAAGDTVKMEMSPYDLDKARITSVTAGNRQATISVSFQFRISK